MLLFNIYCLDPVYCCILSLGLWLEVFHSTTLDGCFWLFIFAFTESDSDAHKQAACNKSKIYTLLGKVLKDLVDVEAMDDDDDKNKGTYLMRKYAST